MTSTAPARVRFRHSAALSVAALVVMVGGVPLVAAQPLLTPILLIPAAVCVWAWRAGTDVDADGIVIRALLGSRRIPWADVDALLPDGRRAQARLVGGGSVALPAVSAADLSRFFLGTRAAVDDGPGSDDDGQDD